MWYYVFMNNKKEHDIHFRLDPQLKKDLFIRARIEEISVSNVLRTAVRRYLDGDIEVSGKEELENYKKLE